MASPLGVASTGMGAGAVHSTQPKPAPVEREPHTKKASRPQIYVLYSLILMILMQKKKKQPPITPFITTT